MAAGTSLRNWGLTLFWLTQLSSVWASQFVALADSHGASTGTCVDIWSSWVTTVARSPKMSGSSGAVPVIPWSE